MVLRRPQRSYCQATCCCLDGAGHLLIHEFGVHLQDALRTSTKQIFFMKIDMLCCHSLIPKKGTRMRQASEIDRRHVHAVSTCMPPTASVVRGRLKKYPNARPRCDPVCPAILRCTGTSPAMDAFIVSVPGHPPLWTRSARAIRSSVSRTFPRIKQVVRVVGGSRSQGYWRD